MLHTKVNCFITEKLNFYVMCLAITADFEIMTRDITAAQNTD